MAEKKNKKMTTQILPQSNLLIVNEVKKNSEQYGVEVQYQRCLDIGSWVIGSNFWISSIRANKIPGADEDDVKYFQALQETDRNRLWWSFHYWVQKLKQDSSFTNWLNGTNEQTMSDFMKHAGIPVHRGWNLTFKMTNDLSIKINSLLLWEATNSFPLNNQELNNPELMRLLMLCGSVLFYFTWALYQRLPAEYISECFTIPSNLESVSENFETNDEEKGV